VALPPPTVHATGERTVLTVTLSNCAVATGQDHVILPTRLIVRQSA
jgi:hypothetical protein